jgi:hypothetical protein
MGEATAKDNLSQSDKFKEAARELGSDEDEKRWEKQLKRVVKAKPDSANP